MIILTEAAHDEIRRLRAQQDAPGPVRLSTVPGGCAGTKYRLDVVAAPEDGDTVVPQDGFDLVCRRDDAELLRGVTVDFVPALMGGGFRYENPNAGGACGCGASFEPRRASGSVAGGS